MRGGESRNVVVIGDGRNESRKSVGSSGGGNVV